MPIFSFANLVGLLATTSTTKQMLHHVPILTVDQLEQDPLRLHPTLLTPAVYHEVPETEYKVDNATGELLGRLYSVQLQEDFKSPDFDRHLYWLAPVMYDANLKMIEHRKVNRLRRPTSLDAFRYGPRKFDLVDVEAPLSTYGIFAPAKTAVEIYKHPDVVAVIEQPAHGLPPAPLNMRFDYAGDLVPVEDTDESVKIPGLYVPKEPDN